MRRLGFRRGMLLAAVALLASGCAYEGPPPGPFPNLTEAEWHLQQAIVSLRHAPPIFDGHKAEAVRLIEQAIGQIEASRASVGE